MDSRWVQIDVERILYVAHGRDTILCDRSKEIIGPDGGTLLVLVSSDAERKLRKDLLI